MVHESAMEVIAAPKVDVAQVTYEEYVANPDRYNLPLHVYHMENRPRIWQAMQETDLAWCVVSVNDGKIIHSCPQAQLQRLPTPENNLAEGKRLNTVVMLFQLPRNLWNPKYAQAPQESSYRGEPNGSDDNY